MGSYSQTFHHTAPTHPVEVKTSMAAKMVTILSLVGSALSHPAGPPAPYAAPAHAVEPPVYNYQYGVSDDYSGSVFSAQENRNNYDTAGEYRVNLPDGRVQVVSYSAGPEGYVADVQYEGEAAYPEAKPYVPAPAYKAAPVVRVAPAPVVVAKPYVPAPVVVAAPYKPVYHATPAYHAAPVNYRQPSGYAHSPINPAYTPKKYGFTIQEEEAPAAKEAAEEPAAEEAASVEEAPEEAAVEEA